jgi:hypothetical protein
MHELTASLAQIRNAWLAGRVAIDAAPLEWREAIGNDELALLGLAGHAIDVLSQQSPNVYASIFAAVMASLPVVKTKLVCFDTAIVDLTEELADPVEVLFGVQLGGGTDINQAVAYCADKVERPTKAHFILITDLYEGGNAEEMLTRVARLIGMGVNVIVLLALSDQGRPAYDPNLSARVAALGVPVFACTPDQFPDLMAAALRRQDIHAWAAKQDIKLVRGDT